MADAQDLAGMAVHLEVTEADVVRIMLCLLVVGRLFHRQNTGKQGSASLKRRTKATQQVARQADGCSK